MSALDGGEWSASCPGCFNPPPPTGEKTRTVEKQKIPAPCWESNPGCPACSLVTILTELSWLPITCKVIVIYKFGTCCPIYVLLEATLPHWQPFCPCMKWLACPLCALPWGAFASPGSARSEPHKDHIWSGATHGGCEENGVAGYLDYWKPLDSWCRHDSLHQDHSAQCWCASSGPAHMRRKWSQYNWRYYPKIYHLPDN
jgi:hypothetical protein